MHQPNQSTQDSGNHELAQDLSCSLPSISSQGTFFPQPIWKIPVVPQIFSWGGHLPAEVNPDILSSRYFRMVPYGYVLYITHTTTFT